MAAYGNVIETFYTDIHELEPGKVKYEAVAEAHKKDPAVRQKYGVNFIKYRVDEEKGLVYCFSSLKDTASILKHMPGHMQCCPHTFTR